MCLESLLEQAYAPHEILVVDDVSKDKSLEIAAHYPVEVIRQETNSGAAGTRNLGASKATGDVIAFLDSDCFAPKDWTLKIAEAFASDPELGGIGGRYSHPPMKTLFGRLSALEEAYIYKVFSENPDETSPCGGNSAYRKKVWNKGRTWRENSHFKGMGSGEDCVVGSEIMKHSKVIYRHDLHVDHHAKENGGYLRRHYNRGYSRTSIMTYNLTESSESSLVFQAYGGWPLFLSSFFLGCSLLTFPVFLFDPVVAGALTGFFLLMHFALSHPFFSYAKSYETKNLEPQYRAGLVTRLIFRGALFLRSLMWIFGTLKGVYLYTRFRIGRIVNVILSILHFWRPGRISKLFYFVTSKCNARCSFCFNLDNVENWKERKKTELSLKEVEKVAKGFGRLPYMTLSGGEPFIRKDLGQMMEMFYKHSKTQWITIPTNAALTKQTVEGTLDILNRCPGVFLTLQVSLDSLFEEHDKSRKLANGFEKMADTLRQMIPIRKMYPNLRIQIATCYDDFNVQDMDKIIDYCRKNFSYDQQIFYLIRETHELQTDGNNHLLNSYIDNLKASEEYEWGKHRQTLWSRAVRALQGIVYRDMVRIKLKKEFVRPCFASQKFATLWDDGNMSPCEILENEVIGNIKDFNYNFYDMKFAKDVDRYHKKEIIDKQCNCDWICAPPLNMIYDVKTFKDIALGLLNPTRETQRLKESVATFRQPAENK